MSSSWLASRRGLKRYGFAAPRIADDLLHAGPGWLGTEAPAEIGQQGGNLFVGHAVGKTRHDGALFPADGANARQYGVGGVARIRRAQRRAEAKVDAAIGQRPI